MTVSAAADMAAGCKVLVGGSPLAVELADQIMEVRVETTVGLPDVCTIRFVEKAPDGTGALKVIDDGRLELAKPLKVQMAKALGGQLTDVFEGEVTTIEAELGASASGTPVLELTVVGHDNSHRMHRKTTTRTFKQVSVTDIARKMAGEHGLKVGKLASLPGGAAEVRHQVGESDWRYLSNLVRGHGGELDVSAGALNIVDPTASKSAAVKLAYGETLQRFRPRLSSVGQVAEVAVHGWDAKGKKGIKKTAKSKASTTVGDAKVKAAVSGAKALLAPTLISTVAEAEARAKAAAAQLGHERMQGTAVAVGDPKLLAGEFVEIAGVGTRFAGTHRIVSATHVYGSKGYVTHLTLGSGGQPLVAQVGARTMSRGFADNLAIGLVTDNKDPDNLGRVKVKYPMFIDDVESGWARIAWGAAGAARGTVALPHVNDEVAVGFEHGDVRRPIVLGALFNGVDKPGADLVKKDSSVAARFPRDFDIATKKKTLFASDEGITMKTAKGPFELTSAQDLKVTTEKGGLLITAKAGEFKADGKAGVGVKSGALMKIEATGPITIESSAVVKIKGSVIQVEASGVLTLKGATVMLG